jgi:hypothetical protein
VTIGVKTIQLLHCVRKFLQRQSLEFSRALDAARAIRICLRQSDGNFETALRALVTA